MFSLLLMAVCARALGGEALITEFRIREGTLEEQQKLYGWTFRSNGKKEFYDLSADAFVRSNAQRFGLPGLEECGMTLTSGAIIFFNSLNREMVFSEVSRKHPGESAVTHVYKNDTGQLVFLNWDKETGVFRLDLSLGPGDNYVLWENKSIPKEIGVPDGRFQAGGSLASFEIQVGTLIPAPAPGTGYIFQSSTGTEELLGTPEEKLQQNGENQASVTPGLEKIGFRLDNGKEYFFKNAKGNRAGQTAVEAANAENPGSKIVAALFSGPAESRVELSALKETPVFRVSLKLKQGGGITIWANRVVDSAEK